MSTKTETKITDALLLPGAIIGLVTGLVSVYKDASLYISIPLFAITAGLICFKFFPEKSIHDFKILRQTMKIDIQDSDGNIAIFTNETLLQAVKNGAHGFEYSLYADGIIEDIKLLTGSIIDKFTEAGRVVVKTHVEKPMKKGEETNHILTSNYINTFTKESGFWQTTKNTPIVDIIIIIVTPDIRPLKEFRAYKMVGQKKILLDNQPKRIFENNKPGIKANFNEVKLLEKCRLEWTW